MRTTSARCLRCPCIPTRSTRSRSTPLASPKGNPYLRIRDDLGVVYEDERFAALFPGRDQPAESPWHLALVLELQYAENLADRQTADAVRSRIDWKYALSLPLTDAGFAASLPASVDARFDLGSLTSNGGLLRLDEAGAARGLRAALVSVMPDWRRIHVQHPIEVLIRRRIFQIAYGYEDRDDANTLRTDPLFKLVGGRLLDETDLAGQPTMSRLENDSGRRTCRDFASGCDRWAP